MSICDLRVSPGKYGDLIETALADLKENNILNRIWSGDYSVWKPEPSGVADRLGWLRIAKETFEDANRLERRALDVRSRGYTNVLLLGMGGSSLAPGVLRESFGACEGYPDLAVLDSTDPGVVLYYADRLDPEKTLFIVASKSGTTTETISFFKYFYDWISDKLTTDIPGDHFIAITDPGSPLASLADQYSFRDTYINNPGIGGRFSALSYFGMVPAALMGLDIRRILDSSLEMKEQCRKDVLPIEGGNPGGILGTVIGALARAGSDKLTIIASPGIESFAVWLEQLIAESTGKEGTGIVPVVGEPAGVPGVYGDDRTFVYLKLAGQDLHDKAVNILEDSGNPVIRLSVNDLYDLGGQFFLWEMATSVAGYILGINPFDQPDVESAKLLTREMIAEYRKSGVLPHEVPGLTSGETQVYANVKADSPAEALTGFLDRGGPGDYVAIQAYLEPTDQTDRVLSELRTKIRDRYGFVTTAGYGPRYLHSTGQLHKGDAGRGLFIQFTADDKRDVPIPDELESHVSSLSFSVLKRAQAIGDRNALLNAGRHVIRFHLGADVPGGIRALTADM